MGRIYSGRIDKMYTGKCLNPQLLSILGEIGHTDTLCVCDAGLPIPQDVERVDLAWKEGSPEWLEVCKFMKEVMVIEKIYLASEIKDKNPRQHDEFLEIFPDVEIEYISHTDLKAMVSSTKGVIRTGEFTPYANCIFAAGCRF